MAKSDINVDVTDRVLKPVPELLLRAKADDFVHS